MFLGYISKEFTIKNICLNKRIRIKMYYDITTPDAAYYWIYDRLQIDFREFP